MPEKLYGFTHLISETKLLSLIASHADEVKVEIFDRRPKNVNGHLHSAAMDAPLLEAPKKKANGAGAAKRKAKRRTTKMSAAKFLLTYLYEHRDVSVTLQELATAAKPYKIPVARLSTSITPAVQRGAMKRVDKGSYKIAKAGIDEVEKQQFSAAVDNAAAAQGTNT